jgi:hypothetical protein
MSLPTVDWGKMTLEERTSPAGVKHWVFVATAAIRASEVEGVRFANAQMPAAGSPGSIALKFYDEMHSHQVFETGPTGVPVAVNEAWWQANISSVPYEVIVASGKTFSTSAGFMLGLLPPPF